MAIRISRYWNQSPTWFYSLPKDVQVLVLAEYRLTHEPPERLKDRQEAIKKARMEKMIQSIQG